METREMDPIEINGTNYMILEVIDKYYYLSEIANPNNIRVFKEDNGYIESIDSTLEEEALSMYYEKHNN